MTQILTNEDGTTKSAWAINANAHQALIVCSSLTTDRSFTLPDVDGTLFLLENLAAVSVDVKLNTSKKLTLPPNSLRMSDATSSGKYLTVTCADGVLTADRTLGIIVSNADASLTILGTGASISGTNTGDQTSVSGNAGTATALQTSRTIGGSSFDGTANVTSFPSPGAIGGTTPAAITCTDLTINGNTIIGDASGDTVTHNASTVTLPNALTYVRTHVDGAAETLFTVRLDEDTGSSWAIVNGTANNATFAPKFQCIQSGSAVAGNFTCQGTTDTGTSPVGLFVAQIGNSTVATRPAWVWRNLTTDIFHCSPGNNIVLKGGSTSPTLDSAVADSIAFVGVDNAAADRNLYVRNEEGKANRLTGLACEVASDFTKTSDTTLANVTGLTRNVNAGEKYAFRAVLFTTSNSSGGVKFAIGGTATATRMFAHAKVVDSSALKVVGTERVTALATTFGDITAVTVANVVIEGEIVVNAAGTLTVQFAQNASNGTGSVVKACSYFELISIGS